MTSEVDDKIVKLETGMATAIVENDAEAIGRFLATDWIIIGPEGGVITRSDFLAVVESGALTHELMEFDDWRVRFYGDTAVATCQAWSKGKFNGEAFHTHERSTSVYHKQDENWRCVFTQLTPMAEE